MKLRTTPSLLALTVSAAVLAPSAAFATNGYFAHGYSTKTNGLAGAGVALPQDAMAAATNPAGMVDVGSRVDVGAAVFSPRREYTVEGPMLPPPAFSLVPENVESDSEYFVLPHFGWNTMLDSESSFGVTVYGNGGMNTNYPSSAGMGGTFFAGAMVPGAKPGAGVDLMQLFIAPTYSRKLGANASWGVSPILAAQTFYASGLATFSPFSTNPNGLTDNGHDTSFGGGVKLGIQGEVVPGLTLAASYQSRIYMTEFEDYEGLFAEQGDFDIPATGTIGLAWNVAPASTIVFDVQHIWYGDVDSIANPFSNLTMGCFAGDVSQCLGGDNGAGFGWDDMTIYKIGYQWQSSPEWTWRVGYSYGEQPISESEVLFNILAPGVMEQHFTFGFTKQMGKNNELSFAAMYAPNESVKGDNPLSPGQTIELEMEQYQLEASWAWKF